MKLANLSPIQRKALQSFSDNGAMNMRELGLALWSDNPTAHIGKQVGNYGFSFQPGLRLVRPATAVAGRLKKVGLVQYVYKGYGWEISYRGRKLLEKGEIDD